MSVVTLPGAGRLSWLTVNATPKASDRERRVEIFETLFMTTRLSPTTFGRISASSVKTTSFERPYFSASPARGAYSVSSSIWSRSG